MQLSDSTELHGAGTSVRKNIMEISPLLRDFRTLTAYIQRMKIQAVRRVLVQSVMNVMSVYKMQTTLLPTSICAQLDRLARNFLWVGTETYAHNHLVHWERVCLPRRYDVLGIRQTREANLAFLAKVGWALESNHDSMACSFLRRKYLNKTSLHEVVRRRGSSSTWRGILHCRPLLLRGQGWLIVDGSRVNIWKDWWVWYGPLLELITGDISSMELWTVDKLITSDKQCDLSSIQDVLPLVCLQKIRAVPLPYV